MRKIKIEQGKDVSMEQGEQGKHVSRETHKLLQVLMVFRFQIIVGTQ